MRRAGKYRHRIELQDYGPVRDPLGLSLIHI